MINEINFNLEKMDEYQFIVVPHDGLPYRSLCNKRDDHDLLDFLQDKVNGYIDGIQEHLSINPSFLEDQGEWKALQYILDIYNRADTGIEIICNEEGRYCCKKNPYIFSGGNYLDLDYTYGNLVVKIPQEIFDKVPNNKAFKIEI